jgi:hypothetical protein
MHNLGVEKQPASKQAGLPSTHNDGDERQHSAHGRALAQDELRQNHIKRRLQRLDRVRQAAEE